jgi:hypothetical protein
MNGPRRTGPEYTGKHRRPTGPGALPPAWAAQPARPEPHLRSVPPPVPSEPGQLTSERWADAG